MFFPVKIGPFKYAIKNINVEVMSVKIKISEFLK